MLGPESISLGMASGRGARCRPPILLVPLDSTSSLDPSKPDPRGIRASRSASAAAEWHDSVLVSPSVLIVDDHADFRASARAMLQRQGFDVVADVEDGEAALGAVERLLPDVVLLDVQLPGMDGFEVAERLAAVPRPPRVVLVSSRRRSAYETRLPGSPVAGFLGKHELTGRALAALL
jgi:CheY-like chemotaxis protein